VVMLMEETLMEEILMEEILMEETLMEEIQTLRVMQMVVKQSQKTLHLLRKRKRKQKE